MTAADIAAQRWIPCVKCGFAVHPNRHDWHSKICYNCLPPPPEIIIRKVNRR